MAEPLPRGAFEAGTPIVFPGGTTLFLRADGTWQEVSGGAHPDLATHDTLGLATQAEFDAHNHDADYEALGAVAAHTGDTADAHDASAISILDTAGDFTATDVEGALAELQADAEAHAADVDGHHARDHSIIGATHNGFPGGTTDFLRADGSFAAPPGGGGGFTLVPLTADVINSNATANTIANVTGLSFAVTAGKTYVFRLYILYTAAASTTGSRWSISGPASPTFLVYTSRYTLTVTTQTLNAMLTAYDLPTASNASSNVSNGGANIAIIEGMIRPSASGTVIARFASEVSNSAITAKVGSLLEWKEAA
jgi:hypothetical protein